MAKAHALALYHVLARCRDVEQEVDKEVFKKVDFVDIEKAPVGARKKAGLKGFFAPRQRSLEIESTHHTVLGCAERKVHHGHPDEMRSELPMPRAGLALLARRAAVGVAIEAASPDSASFSSSCPTMAEKG